MTYTGGELNWLNGKYGISAPHKSVPVMKLIKIHQPKSKEELYALIRSHAQQLCPCGIVSQGTVEDFGQRLYEAQWLEWKQYKYNLHTCIQWEYDLFVVQSLKGAGLEQRALTTLQTALPHHHIALAQDYLDEDLRIDLTVSHNHGLCCGIQVKPISFNHVREGVIEFNRTSNARWAYPVYYLYYNDREEFSNLNEIIAQIKN